MLSAPIVAVEIGTTKTVVLIGEENNDGLLSITGMGNGNSSGIRKGEVINLANASEAFRIALQNAINNTGDEIHTVYLCVSGGHIQSDVNTASTIVADPDEGITNKDIEEVKDVVKKTYNLSPDREILHTLLQSFIIDDNSVVKNPEGMDGNKLSTNALIIHGNTTCINNNINVVINRDINVDDIAFSGMCSALGVLTEEQKSDGAIVIDLGGGTTDYFVFSDNTALAAGSIALGGDHITNDLSLAFNIPVTQAEKIKKDHGTAIVNSYNLDKTISVPPQGSFPGKKFSHYAMNTVINARIDEILHIIRAKLEETNTLDCASTGIILTGGGAKLDGITILANEIFGASCIVGTPNIDGGIPPVINGPEYAACCGLLKYGQKAEREKASSGILKNIIKRFLR